MSSNNDGSITIDKVASDYLHPGEKVKIPQHAIENLMEKSEVADAPTPPEYDAERAPDIHVDDDGNIIETINEKPEPPVVEPAIIEPINSLPDTQPEEILEPVSMDEEEHKAVEEQLQTVEEEPQPVVEDVVQSEPVQENTDSDSIYMEESLERPKEEIPPFIPPKHNVNVKWEPKFADKGDKKDRNIFNELPIMGGNAEEFNYQAQLTDDKDKFDSDNEKMFLAYLKSAADLYHDLRSFDKTLTRDGSQWEQAIMSDIGPLALSRPNFGKSSNQTISGEKAILKMSSIMNLGQLMSIPLWHSGIWVKLKAPSDAALLALENRIAEEKTMLGRQTNGFIFSNSSAYIYDYLINLILSCVYDVTYVKESAEDLKKIIKITDIPTLVWGFLCTIYPNGYPIAQPCINNIGKCNHIEHEMVAISKLMWVDKSSLTNGQIKHMTKRDVKMSQEDILKYQEELQLGGDKVVTINDKLSFRLTVPTIQEYIDSGYKWVEGVERMVTQSFAVAKQGDERNEYILAMSKTMALRQYSHWIKEIQLTEDPTDPDSIMFINDRDTLEEAMDTLSRDVDLGETVMGKITDYIDGATMAVVGIPRYLCPVCNHDQGSYLPENRYIIPLDVVRIFFILQNQRLLKVTLSMSA